MIQVTCTSPLRESPVVREWSPLDLKPQSMMICNQRTGRSTGFLPMSALPLSRKAKRELARPWGMSQAHWRKVRREWRR